MDRYKLEDLKLIYRVLHQHLGRHPDLLDSGFFEELQYYLQQKATVEDVDVSDHGAWDAWLGNLAPSCEVRMANRFTVT